MSDALAAALTAALAGTYTVERELGGGGMSRVFLATEPALGRRVVVKVLGHAGGAGLDAERFRREILLSARLQHPNIVPVLTAGEVDGLPYFVMPFVDGPSLRERLRSGGALPVAEAARVLRDVAAALAYAHQQGVVHRDIKPDNVMLSGGVGVVVDFGVAKALAASQESHTALTSAGIAVGTPAYMAPEQAAGDPAVDARADLYALGILAYEALTGTTPFGGRDPHLVLRAHLTETPPPITSRREGLPPALAALVMHCLEKSPRDRPPSAGAILALLDEPVATTGGMRAAGAGSTARRVAAATLPPLIYSALAAVALAALARLAAREVIAPRAFVAAIVVAVLGLPAAIALAQVRLIGLAEGAEPRWWRRLALGAFTVVALVTGGLVLAQGRPAAAASGAATIDDAAARDADQARERLARGDSAAAVVLLQAAVVRDSAFAAAWRELGVLLAARGSDTALARAALQKAYDLRDRLTDRERLLTVAAWYRFVTGERERAMSAYAVYLDLVPEDAAVRAALAALEAERTAAPAGARRT